jgi:hypothetical protein
LSNVESTASANLIESLVQFLKRQYDLDAVKTGMKKHMERAFQRGKGLKTFGLLVKSLKSPIGLEDVMWLLAAFLHTRRAEIKEQGLVVGDVAARILNHEWTNTSVIEIF